jgi:hypothetical protein
MKITAVSIVERKNTGPYSHVEMNINAELPEGSDYEKKLKELRGMLSRSLDLEIASEVSNTNTTTAAEPSRVQKVTDKISGAEAEINHGGVVGKDTLASGQEIPPVIKEKKTAPRSSKAKETANVETPSNAGTDSSVAGSTATGSDTGDKSKTVATASIEKGTVLYDAAVKEHRSRFATYLGQNYPKWTPDAQFGKLKEGETPNAQRVEYSAKVTAFSKGLHQKPFENSKGEMLPVFKAELEAFFAYAK